MAGDIFIFRPLSSFFNMLADLTNSSLSSSSLNSKNACVIGLAGQHVLHFLFCRVVVKFCHYGSFLVLVFL